MYEDAADSSVVMRSWRQTGSPSIGERLGNGFTICSTMQWLQNSELHTFTVQQCR